MKILRLDLIACGPFSGISLDLNNGNEGLHLIYGPNEAGKSSALRAIGYLLYGIPERCEDDFLHTYQKLRIGGMLRTGSGIMIEAIRRKARSNSLRAPDDSPLDEALWHEVCGRISCQDFSRRFGIDHEALVEGGREIVNGGGELADVLFAAGAGVAAFRRIEDQVLMEANDLFKPGGSKPKINELLSALREEQRRLRELQLPNETWDTHFKAHQTALSERKAVQVEIERKEQERNRLKRIQNALPLIGRRKGILRELADHASTPILPEDFSEKRQRSVQDFRLEEQNAGQAKQNLDKLRSELNELKISPAVLNFSQEISDLYLKLGSHRKALSDRPNLFVQKKALEDQAKELLAEFRRDFPFEKVEDLRLPADEEVLIRNLGAKREKYAANLENTLEKISELTLAIAEITEKLLNIAVPQDTSKIQIALDDAKSYGRIEDELSQTEIKIVNAERQASVDLKGLELWEGGLDDLERLPAPDPETIEDFESRILETESEIGIHTRELEKLSQEIRDIETKVSALKAGDVPSLEDLEDSRALRDSGWKLIRGLMDGVKGGEEDERAYIAQVSEANTLPEAFEKNMHIADELSDRLRREADRVAEYNTLIAAGTALEIQRNEVLARKEQIVKSLEVIRQDWTNLWLQCGISPGLPKQMRRWVSKRSELVRKWAEIKVLRSEAEYRGKKIEELKGVLEKCLIEIGHPTETGESLQKLVAKTTRVIEAESKILADRDRLENDLQQRRHELRKIESQREKAKSELKAWQTQWETAISPLGLDGKSIPEQANAMLSKLQEIFAKLKEAKGFGHRLDEIDTDFETFKKQAEDLLSLTVPELQRTSLEKAVSTMNDLMNTAKADEIRSEGLSKKIGQEEKSLSKALSRIESLKIEIGVMLEEAACDGIEAFPEAERRSARKKELIDKLEQIEEQLVELASGSSIEEFSGEAEAEDPDLIQPRLKRIEEEIDGLDAKKSELDQTIGREEGELRRMDGRGDAAELAQQIQGRLADIENNVRQCSRLKLAHALLLRAKERHREMSQGPVIKRTSELFRALTLGSFEGVRAETDDSGTSVIVGFRQGGEETVSVQGMSDGTADQLYLALRLASFEYYVSQNEAQPLILDDILIRFDNERARATLKVLAKISKKTQILMFTHHSHLVELAQSELGRDHLFVQDLSRLES
ncbi:MAG: AAA family ATPase [Syntrophobacteraceae bacterium]|jgi:uncharacterized protein YhaN